MWVSDAGTGAGQFVDRYSQLYAIGLLAYSVYILCITTYRGLDLTLLRYQEIGLFPIINTNFELSLQIPPLHCALSSVSEPDTQKIKTWIVFIQCTWMSWCTLRVDTNHDAAAYLCESKTNSWKWHIPLWSMSSRACFRSLCFQYSMFGKSESGVYTNMQCA